MPDINAGKIIRFEDGASVTITPAGGSAATIKNIIGGSFRWLPVVREMLPPDIDRGEMLDDIREGDEQPGEIDFDIKHTADDGSTQLYEELVAASADGYGNKFTIVIDQPDFTGATTGLRYTATNAVRREAPEITAGQQFDTIKARFICTATAKSTYSP